MSTVRTCAYCGKPLAGKREQYCSDACRLSAREADFRMANRALGRKKPAGTEPRDKVCMDCGAHFPGYPRSLRCEQCRLEAKKRSTQQYKARRASGNARPLGSTDLCVMCGKPYTVNGGLQTMCPECAILRRNEKALARFHEKYTTEEARNRRNEQKRATIARAQELRTRMCPTCGKAFTPTREHRSYCSDACAQARTLTQGNEPPPTPHGATGKPKSQFVRTQNGQRRLAAGLTKDQLGELAGLHPRTIYDWEHGRRISDASREAIERALEPYEKHTTQ